MFINDAGNTLLRRFCSSIVHMWPVWNAPIKAWGCSPRKEVRNSSRIGLASLQFLRRFILQFSLREFSFLLSFLLIPTPSIRQCKTTPVSLWLSVSSIQAFSIADPCDSEARRVGFFRRFNKNWLCMTFEVIHRCTGGVRWIIHLLLLWSVWSIGSLGWSSWRIWALGRI